MSTSRKDLKALYLFHYEAFSSFCLDAKRTKKIKALCKSNDFAKIYGGAKPNSPLLRRDSNMVLLNPPPISQNRDWHKADSRIRLAKVTVRWIILQKQTTTE